jgi:hypothetical protein
MTQIATTAAQTAGKTFAAQLPRIGAQIAAQQAGTVFSNLVFGPAKRVVTGAALDAVRVLSAGEGGGVPRVYGRSRVGGQVIWASPVREEREAVTSGRGGKGARRSVKTETTEFRYSVSLAIALCEGPITRIGRVWADGRLIRLDDYDVRIYHGTEDQMPDPLLSGPDGDACAYRGVAYIVFEDLPLAPFGQRVPQFNFEVERSLVSEDPHALENAVRAVTIIPGSGEAVYETAPLFSIAGEGVSRSLNAHASTGETDLEASLDHLEAVFPNLGRASLVVSWFGDDLRAGECRIEPGVETRERVTEPRTWSVAGRERGDARLINRIENRPVYGGTPSDHSVLATIRELKGRGLSVMFHPFILIDIVPGNGLPDPYGGQEQAAFPWRGRMTSTADRSAAARSEIAAFFASYRPMILHYAALCLEAGGVERFLVGSELRGLTRLRDEANAFPAVEELVSLAREVKEILPDTEVSYGADWTEYGAYVPGDGDLFFPLDDFWADQSVGFVGIDNYMPLSDWRDTPGHADAELAASHYDQGYLASGIKGGEGYDWYYRNDADREAQARTLIEDGAFGEPWVFRVKDLWSFWSEAHHPRIGGVRHGPTPWVPETKPFVFTEIGCPAIDKGPNQPNVFVDPKSSESAPPHFSTGNRDDAAQRACLEAQHRYWTGDGDNPFSSVDGRPMVDPGGLYVYAWDARPYPEFPLLGEVWADGPNWVTGHWLNGRAGRLPLGVIIERLCREAGLGPVDASSCTELVTGLHLPGPERARESLEPLLDLYQLDAVSRGGVLHVEPRRGEGRATLGDGDLVAAEGAPVDHRRAQDEELPSALSLTYTDEFSDYGIQTTEARDESRTTVRTERLSSAVVMDEGEARSKLACLLAESRLIGEEVRFSLPETADGIGPGSVVTVPVEGQPKTLRVVSATGLGERSLLTVGTHPSVFAAGYRSLPGGAGLGERPVTYGPVAFAVLDLPLLDENGPVPALHFAAFAEPWPEGVAVHAGTGPEGDRLALLDRQSLMGRLTAPLRPGITGRWDRASRLRLRLPSGSLSSLPESDILAGRHSLAVEAETGASEILQFSVARLEDDGSWTLSNLLRGRFGTEEEARAGAGAGARVVFLKSAEAFPVPLSRLGETLTLQSGPAGTEPGAFPFVTARAVAEGVGLRPLAPVHLREQRDGGGRKLRWMRRSRVGGDRWNGGDIPLGEARERYLVTIRDAAGGVLESLETARREVPVPQPEAASVEVAQLSEIFGAGRTAVLRL